MKVKLTTNTQAIRREFIPKSVAGKLAGDTVVVVGQAEDEDGVVYEVQESNSKYTWMVSENVVDEVIE